jgi:hypothetical protein
MELSGNWFQSENDTITYDLITAIILFFWFNNFIKISAASQKKLTTQLPKNTIKITKFIQLKIATILIPVVLVLAIFPFANWIIVNQQIWMEWYCYFQTSTIYSLKISLFFYNHWCNLTVFLFSTLIVFIKSFATRGFVISTILIKLSRHMESSIML